MSGGITLEQLSRYTGEPEERLREWHARGVIGDREGAELSTDDVERVRLLQLFLRRGIELDAVAEAMRSGQFDWYLNVPFRDQEGPFYPLAEAAQKAGLSLDTMQRFRQAMGSTGPDDIVSEQELSLIQGWNVAGKAGVPEDAMVEMIRVYHDNLSRVAEAEQRIFRFYVQRRLEAEGASPAQFLAQGQAVADQLTPLIEPIIIYFHRRGLTTAAREDIVMTVAEQLGLVKKPESQSEVYLAPVFIDISSFTPLAGAMGDVAAARVLERFSEIVRRAAGSSSGRVVKQIGDAFMLAFPEPRSAVACALEIDAQAAGEPQFPAVRAGIHWGTALYREGDYVGTNVNIASRLADVAERHQVLVSGVVRKESAGVAGVEFVSIGRRRLKGVPEEIEVFEARLSQPAPSARLVDPVCGMEMTSAEVAARLTLEGEDRTFCSEDCLRKFVASPERYT